MNDEAEVHMLQRGDRIPHFTVTTAGGAVVRYEDIWQRDGLLLVSMPAGDASMRAYADRLARRERDVTAHDARYVVTHDVVPGVPHPGVTIVDRWGEVYAVFDGASASDLPAADEVVEWLRYIHHECPECQGEAR
jgi:peroxiredoxin